MPASAPRIPILYLAPWVDIGGSDKGTIDWFQFLDRTRFRASLITTQPSENRRLAEIAPYAEEIWDLPTLMPGNEFARFILTFVHTRGVQIVHIMNSRIAFELLPDLVQLVDRPRIVVQLHVEEEDHSGYVRYVSTRYGNLVDAFSVSSQALSDALGGYDVPVAKRRLIRTGVDAKRELAPDRITPVSGLDQDSFHVLFPVRLTPQKEPGLVVEIAQRLRARGLRSQVHVVGEGGLAPVLQAGIAAHGLSDEVILHGASLNIAPWYAACDLVLLTSRWEGVPYVAYEAMAMAKPLVAPDLPGICEVVTADHGVLISAREDPDAYAAAIAALAADPARRVALGVAGRERVLSAFSLQRMAAEHGSLYEELLAGAPARHMPAATGLAIDAPSPGLRARQPGAHPLVSVIVPCFDHGRYLSACLDSIAAQDYPLIETIVVDDGSTDPETLERVAELEQRPGVTVVRLAANRGPSAARNAAVERARGRYVLPVDADNLLLPGAITALVDQLSRAGERIGFIYPNVQYFGNRSDRFEPPSYNLDSLLSFNYCDTSSLIDRDVFDRGFRYPEDIGLGHEDWDFVLSLAEAGIYGEPARADTVLYRKHGFGRSDLVDAGNVGFASVIADRHPGLFAGSASQKAHWSPALSVIAVDPLPEGAHGALGELVRFAARQTCQDFELIIFTAADLWPTELGGRLRRLPRALAASRAGALASGLSASHGRYTLASYGSPAELLADSTQIEKVLRALQFDPAVGEVALADADAHHAPFALLDGGGAERAVLGALCWTTDGPAAPTDSVALPASQPLEALAHWFTARGRVHWRHVPRRDRHAIADAPNRGIGPAGAGRALAPGTSRALRDRDARLRAEKPVRLPQLPSEVGQRVNAMAVWMPPQAQLLCRHLHHPSGRFVFTNQAVPPAECSLHFYLGSVRVLPLAGTRSLRVSDSDSLGKLESEFTFDENVAFDQPGVLGYVEQAPLPLFDSLVLGRHAETGQSVLIAGAEDPLAGSLTDRRTIGYIEPYPIHPRQLPDAAVHCGLLGLVRSLDRTARRHRYAAGNVPPGQLAGELGALLKHPLGDCEPIWLDGDGRVVTSQWTAGNGRVPLNATVRWAGAPLAWRGFSTPTHRLRATARRTLGSARILAAGRPAPAVALGEPAGYLMRAPSSRSLSLYVAIHPVTGDQLLSTDEREAVRLGYEPPTLLGYLAPHAPVTGTLGLVRPGIPWASHFGLSAASR